MKPNKDNLVQKKSYDFAIKVVKLCQDLVKNGKEFVLSKQLLRSGTSIGANVEEAIGAQSRADFYAKISVAYKEARETAYWLRLLKDTEYLDLSKFETIYRDVTELNRIISSIKKSTKDKALPNS
jgi:four helix bundle protein